MQLHKYYLCNPICSQQGGNIQDIKTLILEKTNENTTIIVASQLYDNLIKQFPKEMQSLIETEFDCTGLAELPDVDQNGKSSVPDADKKLIQIRDQIDKLLQLIINNRSSQYYIDEIKESIKFELEENVNPKDQVDKLKPKIKLFLEQVISTKDMLAKDPWNRYVSFKDLFNNIRLRIPENVRQSFELESYLNDLFGKNPSVKTGLEEKSKRIGMISQKESERVFEYFQKIDRSQELKMLDQIDILTRIQKQFSIYCDSKDYMNILSVDMKEINYVPMKLVLLSPNIIMLENDGGNATIASYIAPTADKITINVGAFTNDGWIVEKNKNKFLVNTSSECVFPANVNRVEKNLNDAKSHLRDVRDTLNLEFNRKFGHVIIANNNITLANLMRAQDDLSRIDKQNQQFLDDTELIKDPIISLMILNVFPENKKDTYKLKGKCLYDGCEELWQVNDKTKRYYERNALRFFELNYDVDMNKFGTEAFGKMKLEGDGNVRQMKYMNLQDQPVNINVCPITGTDWEDGLFRLCGPNQEPVKNHYWDMPIKPQPPTISQIIYDNDQQLLLKINVNNNDVLKEIRIYSKQELLHTAIFNFNNLGYYTKDLKWVPAQPSKIHEIKIPYPTKSPITIRCVDVFDNESSDSEEIQVDLRDHGSPANNASDIDYEWCKAKADTHDNASIESKMKKATRKLQEKSDLSEKYSKMKKMGLPDEVIKHKIKIDYQNDTKKQAELIQKLGLNENKGGGKRNIDITLNVPVIVDQTGTMIQIVMEKVDSETTIIDLKAMIIELLKENGIMKEYYIYPDRKGYNSDWKSFMVKIYNWDDEITIKEKHPLSGKEMQINVSMSDNKTRQEIQKLLGDDTLEFVNWLLDGCACVTVGSRHFEGLKDLLENKETLDEYKSEYDKDIKKIINGEYTDWRSIPANTPFKDWLSSLGKNGVWECTDPENRRAKFSLKNVRDVVRKIIWETKEWNHDQMVSFANKLTSNKDQVDILLSSIMNFNDKDKIVPASFSRLGGFAQPGRGPFVAYKFPEKFDKTLQDIFKTWMDNLGTKPKNWQEMKHKLMCMLVPRKFVPFDIS